MYTKANLADFLVEDARERAKNDLFAFEAFKNSFFTNKFSRVFEANKNVYVEYLRRTAESMSDYPEEDADNYTEFFYNNEEVFANSTMRARFLPSDVRHINPKYLNEMAFSIRKKINGIISGAVTDSKVFAKREYGENIKRKMADIDFKYSDKNIDKLKFDRGDRVVLNTAFVKNNIYPFLENMDSTKSTIISDANNAIAAINSSYDHIADTYNNLNAVLDKGNELPLKAIQELNDFTFYVNKYYSEACAFLAYVVMRKANTFQYNSIMIDRIYNHYSDLYEFATESSTNIPIPVANGIGATDMSQALTRDLVSALTGTGNLKVMNDTLNAIVARNRNYVASAVSSQLGYTEPEIIDSSCAHYMYKDPKYAKLAAAYDGVNITVDTITSFVDDYAGQNDDFEAAKTLNIKPHIDNADIQNYLAWDFDYRPNEDHEDLQDKIMRRYAELVQCQKELNNAVESSKASLQAIDDKIRDVTSKGEDPDCENPVTIADTLSKLSLYKKEFENKQLEVGKFFIDRVFKLQSEILAIASIMKTREGIQLEEIMDEDLDDDYIVEDASMTIEAIEEAYSSVLTELYNEYSSEVHYRKTGKRLIFEDGENTSGNNANDTAANAATKPQPTTTNQTSATSSNTTTKPQTTNNPVSKGKFLDTIKRLWDNIAVKFIAKSEKLCDKYRQFVTDNEQNVLNMNYTGVSIKTFPYILKNIDTMMQDIGKVKSKISAINVADAVNWDVGKVRGVLFDFIPANELSMKKGAGQSQMIIKWYTLGRNNDKKQVYKDGAAKNLTAPMYGYVKNYDEYSNKVKTALDDLINTVKTKCGELYNLKPVTTESVIEFFEDGENEKTTVEVKPQNTSAAAASGGGNVDNSKGKENSNSNKGSSGNSATTLETEVRGYGRSCVTALERVYYEYISVLTQLVGKSQGVNSSAVPDNNSNEENNG